MVYNSIVMRSLHLNLTSRTNSIPFFIGDRLWSALYDFLQKHFPTHAIRIIADQNVADLHGKTLLKELQNLPRLADILTFPAGEASKSRQQKMKLEDALLEQKCGRDTVILAVGGGVSGDMAGYVAATLHRGVPLIHLPGSLLAQVDSSIGGKVGINHPAGKNLLGAFYQPHAVFCDLSLLETLPEVEYINGLAEVVKYGIIQDMDLWDLLDRHSAEILQREKSILAQIVERCISLKIDIVEKDEKESGLRSLLNWGHTVGHAIENLGNYTIKHGFAIAAGMRVAARLSATLHGFPQSLVERQFNTLQNLKLNTLSLQPFDADDVWEVMTTDKKSRQQSPRFTLLGAEGQPVLYAAIQKKEFLHAYTAEQTVC